MSKKIEKWHFAEIDDGLEAFFPWGRFPIGASTAYLIDSFATREQALSIIRRSTILGTVTTIGFTIVGFWLGLRWSLTVFDLVLYIISRNFALIRFEDIAVKLPRRLSLKIGADWMTEIALIQSILLGGMSFGVICLMAFGAPGPISVWFLFGLPIANGVCAALMLKMRNEMKRSV